ncbi:MAG: hypothetical protein Q8O53_01500 [Candidatus Moranbacteria bacterium]|nr:hypothetical protein [Candidatus Moranbacteria bacterium]
MAKNIFFFSLSLLVLVLIFLAAYNLIFKNNVNSPLADPSKKIAEGVGDAPFATGIAENVLNESVLGATMSDDNEIFYYSGDDQALKKANRDGKNKVILMSNLPGEATRVLWSAKKDRVLILLKQRSGGTLWYSISLGNKTLVPLKPEIGRLAWDNFGEKIFYQYTDPVTNKRTMNSANADGSDWKKLADLGAKDFFLTPVPQSNFVSFWARSAIQYSSPLETVSALGEGRRMVSTGFFGADYSWSPDGEYVLASGSMTDKGNDFSLRLVTKNGEVRNLSLPTLISKTVWSDDSKTLYYALPGSLPEGTLLPNDYFEKPLYTKDTFWKVDITTGKKTRLIELKENTMAFDSNDLFLPTSEDALYFTDRVSKKLYRIEL